MSKLGALPPPELLINKQRAQCAACGRESLVRELEGDAGAHGVDYAPAAWF